MNSIGILSLRDSLALVICCALSTHVYLNKREVSPDNSILVLAFFLIFPGVLSVVLFDNFPSLVSAAIASYLGFYATVSLSVIAYRFSPWHPLARYPGPVLLRLSKIFGAVFASRGKGHVFAKELHDKYGPYVRIGPNELSIVDVNALGPTLGADGLPKGPIWDGRRSAKGPRNLQGLRDPVEHAQRRRVWNRAFTTASVKEYEPAIVKRCQQLVERLESAAGPVNLSQWFSFFTFDFMGDMLFGGGFELMRDGDTDNILELITEASKNVAIMQHVPWATRLLLKIPVAASGIIRFREFAGRCLIRRREEGAATKDVFHHIMDEDGLEPEPPSLAVVMSDAGLAVIAGSDTTSSTLAGLFFYLLSHRAAYERLRNEVDDAFPAHSGYPFDSGKLSGMQYLNAVINETLRLQPALPVSLQRAPSPGSGGKFIGDIFIPEGTAVNIPPYALHRDPRYFSPSPDSFMPERWLRSSKQQTQDTGAEDKFRTTAGAFIPFSMGPANCVGKNLAMTQLRMVVALLMQQFDMHFATDIGYEPEMEWERDMEEWFVVKPGRLMVCLSKRV